MPANDTVDVAVARSSARFRKRTPKPSASWRRIGGSADRRLGGPRRGRGQGRSARAAAQRAVDLLEALSASEPEVDRVRAVLEAHGETEVDLTSGDVQAMLTAAQELREVFAARNVGEAAEVLNRLLAKYAHPPRLTDHADGFGWHLHVDSADDGPWGAWLVTSSALGLAVLLADRQAPPGGLCAASGCGKPFAHLGGGSPRRYCSTRCATRERVAAHRRKPS